MRDCILGLSAYYHDSAAALLRGGEVVAAAQEERFTRVKFDAAFPARSIEYCLRQAGLDIADVDRVVFYDKPFVKFGRILETYLAFAPRGFASFRKALPAWLKEKLFLKQLLVDELAGLSARGPRAAREPVRRALRFSDHHLSHAASAYYPSPFDEAAVLVLDGVGEWATASAFLGRGRELTRLREIRFPHSIGLLYSAFTHYCGFKVNSGEYKLMGLAPYGAPSYAQLIRDHLIDVADDGSFRLDLRYFGYCTGLEMTTPRFDALFGGPRRREDEPMTQRHKDLAASIQAVTEEVLLKLCRSLAKETSARNLCLAGGVALNCVANGRIEREGIFDRLWVQPAAGDAGGALGAALVGHHLEAKAERTARPGDSMGGSYLGPEHDDAEVRGALESAGARFAAVSSEQTVRRCADLLASGKAIGWFHGRMEFGPRALGCRSILADPRSASMQRELNLKIKFRESFRPFAPAVLSEDLAEWFSLACDSPYMMLVAQVRQGRSIPAVTHVDGSARVQTVHRETNPLFHALLSSFKEKTGCPVLVNTSFNVRGEPIVNTPEEAFRCFMGTDLDALSIGGFLLLKHEQDPALRVAYHQGLEKD